MNPYSHFSIPALDQFLIWLSGTPLRVFFYQFERFDGAVVFAHVLGAGTLFGAILLIDLRLMGVGKVETKGLAQLAIPWAIVGAAIALLSGVVLFLFDPIAVGVHTYFAPKMALIVLGLINALSFHTLVRLRDAGRRTGAARFAGALSIAIWAGVFLCASLNGTERISSSIRAMAPPAAASAL